MSNNLNLATHNWDILIKNSSIYDGSGTSPFSADVAIKGKHIAAIGKLTDNAKIIIDAKNLALCPEAMIFLFAPSHASNVLARIHFI